MAEPVSPISTTSRDGAQRRRLFACQMCARRKQRCDKLLPVCTACRKTGAVCVSANNESSVIRERDGVTRKGPLRLLEEEVARLEAEARRRGLLGPDSSDQHHRTEEVDHEPSPSLRISEPIHAEREGEEEEAVHESHYDHENRHWQLEGSVMNIPSLSLSAMAEPQNRAGEFLKQLSIPRLIAGMTETYGGNPEKTSRLDCLWDGIARDIRHPSNTDNNHRLALDRDGAQNSLELYMNMVDFRFPRIQLAIVRSGLDAITADSDDLYVAALSANPASIFMAYMVIAIVPLVSDRYPVSHGSFVSMHLLAKSLRVLDHVFCQEDGVDIIQCLHLLVIFAIHSSAAGSSWHLIGFAMNKCIALGYHKEALPPGSSNEDMEQRRWAFWGCYLLDTLISGALGRPKSLDDRYITVALPSVSNSLDSQRRDIDTLNIHLFQYARLMSHVIWNDGAERSFESHLNGLLHWRALTPSLAAESLQKTYEYQTSLFNTLMLRAIIEEIILWPGQAQQPRDSASWAERLRSMRALDVCRAVVRSHDRYTMSGRSYLSMITGYTSFSVGLTLQLCRSLDRTDEAIASTRDLVESVRRKLDIVARQFPRTQHYLRILDRLDEWTRLACQGQQQLLQQQPVWEEERLRGEVEQLTSDIGPRHLRSLASVIVDSLQRRCDSVE